MWLYIPPNHDPSIPTSTSSPSVPGTEDSTWESGARFEALARSATWSAKSQPPLFWSRAWKKGGWIKLLSGLTSLPSTVDASVDSWISSLRASRAKARAWPASVWERLMNDGSGPRYVVRSTIVRSPSYSLRTSPGSSPSTTAKRSRKSSATWPRWGSMRSGAVTALSKQELRIVAIAGSVSGTPRDPSSPASFPWSMWPTPTATPYGSSQNGVNGVGGEFERPSANKPSLENMARIRTETQWPTPRATDNRGPGESTKRDGGPSLTTVAHAWPTPTATDAKAAGYSTDSGRHSGTTLTDAAVRQWATPAARDWKDGACEAANVPTKALLGRQAVRWATPQAHDLQPPKTPAQIAAMKDRTGAGVSNLNEQASMWATPVASPNANRMTKAAPSHGNSHGHVLAGQAASWPTPVATLQSTAPSTTGAATLNGTAQATTSGLHDPTTSTDGERTSSAEDPSPPSSRRRVLNPRFVEALMGLPPGWISVLPTLPTTTWRFSTSDDLTSSGSPETESSHNKPHSPSSISDEEPWEGDANEEDDADAA